MGSTFCDYYVSRYCARKCEVRRFMVHKFRVGVYFLVKSKNKKGRRSSCTFTIFQLVSRIYCREKVH